MGDFTGFDDFNDYDFEDIPPEGFFPDDLSTEQSDLIEMIRNVIGQPIAGLVTTYEDLQYDAELASNIRASRFASGVEALLWLFRRGIFLYSKIIKFADGSWGVAIGNSPQPGAESGQVGLDLAF